MTTIIFQPCGALPRFRRHVMEVLTATFPGRWIGRGGSIPWPPRSPDLTPPDFFFWGYVKNYMYMDKIQDLNHFKARIPEAVEQVTRDTLQCAWQEVEHQLDICSHRQCTCGNFSIMFKTVEVHFKIKY
jgi:hypothetical protein